MKTITKYVAIDGTEFKDKAKCIDYEALITTVNSIMAQIPTSADGVDFANGDGYILHDIPQLKKVKIQILELCKAYIKHDWVQQTIDRDDIHSSWVARLLDDYGIRPLSKAWYRFQCIDADGREWGQPYYAEHPNEAKQTQLN